MAFWTDTQNIASPKRNFRFKVQFSPSTTGGGGFNQATDLGTSEAYWAKTATKPGFTLGVAEHNFLNHTFKFPGRVSWNDVTVTMVDPGGANGVGFALAQMLKDAGYSIPNEGQYQTISKEKAVTGTTNITITQMDADGNAIEKWTLNNAFISEASFGSLDYGSDELTEYSITIKYDWAEMEGVSYTASSGTGTGTITPGGGTSSL